MRAERQALSALPVMPQQAAHVSFLCQCSALRMQCRPFYVTEVSHAVPDVLQHFARGCFAHRDKLAGGDELGSLRRAAHQRAFADDAPGHCDFGQ